MEFGIRRPWTFLETVLTLLFEPRVIEGCNDALQRHI